MDRRELARSKRVQFIEEGGSLSIVYSTFDKERDDYVIHTIPARWNVCASCEGHGKYVNPSIDSNGITASEMDELGPDFERDYRSGVYDVTCAQCDGRRVVPWPDGARCTLSQLTDYVQAMNDAAREAQQEANEARWGF